MPEARKDSSEGSNKPSVGSPAPDPQKEVFDRGRLILGKDAGGLVTKLLKHCAGDCRRALDLLRLVEGKSDPREYLGAILRGDADARSDEVLAETERLYRNLGVS